MVHQIVKYLLYLDTQRLMENRMDKRYVSDYVIEINGRSIVVEIEGKKNRTDLLNRYKSLLEASGKVLSDKQAKSLAVLVENMTEAAAKERMARYDWNDEGFISSLMEVVDATADDPEQESVMINGNKFLFEKGSIDINTVANKLYAIGEQQKGETWTIYLDADGELVIY